MAMKKINLDELNKLLNLTLTAPTSKLSSIINGVKLLIATAFILARYALIKEEKEKEQWEYRKKQLNSIDDDLKDSDIF